MSETVEFELVSPERLLKSEPVEMVVVPGAEGNLGILPGHSLLIATMRPGVIDVHKDSKVVEYQTRFLIMLPQGWCLHLPKLQD